MFHCINKYILKPIRSLVLYTKAIKEKDEKINKHEKYLVRKDEMEVLFNKQMSLMRKPTWVRKKLDEQQIRGVMTNEAVLE